MRDMVREFSDVGAMTFTTLNMTGSGSPERFSAAVVSVGFLRALRVTPVAGRLFADGEDQSGHDNGVVVLSHRLAGSRASEAILPSSGDRSRSMAGRP